MKNWRFLRGTRQGNWSWKNGLKSPLYCSLRHSFFGAVVVVVEVFVKFTICAHPSTKLSNNLGLWKWLVFTGTPKLTSGITKESGPTRLMFRKIGCLSIARHLVELQKLSRNKSPRKSRNEKLTKHKCCLLAPIANLSSKNTLEATLSHGRTVVKIGGVLEIQRDKNGLTASSENQSFFFLPEYSKEMPPCLGKISWKIISLKIFKVVTCRLPFIIIMPRPVLSYMYLGLDQK